MRTCNDYLDACKTKLGLVSDYQLSKHLDCATSRISNYRNGRSHFDDQTARMIASILEIPAAQVIAAAHFERSKMEEDRVIWKEIFEKFGGIAAGVLLSVGLFSAPTPSHASSAADPARICIM